MEVNSASNEPKELNEEDVKGKLKNCDGVRHKCLLCLFIEYAWDESDGQISGCKGIELTSWLTSEELNVNDEFWCFSSKLDVRVATKLEPTDENLPRKARDSNSKRILAQLAYNLRKVLSMLMTCSDDAKYINDDGRTVLHIFIENLIMAENFSEEQIFRIRRLFDNLAERAAPFLANDKRGKTPIHVAAACKSNEIIKVLISSLKNVNECDEHGNTALHIVVDSCVNEQVNHKDGYVDIARTLVSRGADVNAKSKEGITAAHLAAAEFHVEMLKFLVDSGADCSLRAKDDKTPLHFACKSTLKLKDTSKAVETVDLLVSQGCDVEALDKEGYAPLHYAAEHLTVRVVERLIELGASVDRRSTETLVTPLYLAAKSNRLDSMKRLVEAGAEVNAEGLDGTTPLFMSVSWGSFASMQYLIDRGADVYGRDNVAGFTLLHMAAYMDSKPKVEAEGDNERSRRKIDVLIEKNLNVNDPAICGISPLQLATIPHHLDNVKILLERGANVNFQGDSSEFTALHIAAAARSLGIAKILVENGADVNRRGGVQQMTPLHVALMLDMQWDLGKYPADVKHKDISFIVNFWPKSKATPDSDCDRFVALLMENGADVNVKDASGKTPLHFAVLHSRSHLIKRLVESDARVNVQDAEGRLPLHDVVEKGNAEGLKLLLDFGADINDDDTIELIMKSSVELKNLVTEHAIKLKLVGLPIAKVYEPLVRAPEFADFYERCSTEVTKLIDHRDAAGFSLYEFLRMSAKRQYRFVDKVLGSRENLEDQFPMYASLILAARRQAIDRKPHLESARLAWTKISTVYLPEVCVDKILDHLNNRYLEWFAGSANDDEKIFIDEGVKRVIWCTHRSRT